MAKRHDVEEPSIKLITQQQIADAKTIKSQVPSWNASEKALIWLGKNKPGIDLESCLLKCVAVNALYATGILDIAGLAQHVVRVVNSNSNTSWSEKNIWSASDVERKAAIELVEEIANFELSNGERRHNVSFASKFCHFFISQAMFPIYDTAVREAMQCHTGGRITTSYESFCSKFRCLSTCRPPTTDVDNYLWLKGMYARYVKGKRVNAGLREFFKSQPMARELKRSFADGPSTQQIS